MRYYSDLKRSVEHAGRMISKLTWQTAPGGVNAVSISPTGGCGGSHVINTFDQLYQLQKWREVRDNTNAELEKIDIVLDGICAEPGCELYARVLIMWYVDRATKEDIADELGYSRSSMHSIYDVKNRALKKFAVSLFGIDALKAI